MSAAPPAREMHAAAPTRYRRAAQVMPGIEVKAIARTGPGYTGAASNARSSSAWLTVAAPNFATARPAA